ncbi:CehA/McbA family metallohydrolase [Pelagibacterium xiamenense]|uniref:CehA/McbA family metallohydrolase n=1 Tax=Pelagibacterium xiamenense TaxID=2901140 RepID=UPI001E57DDCC|nr:CehA/McbA family metallohydrolase [Pelagibacterium xiamenense]MCD7059800.1 CehA/McbA family metallohydrolase [Pelagibacterium xiamenense]
MTQNSLTPVEKTAPDITIARTLSAADKARDPYFHVPFEVPEGATRIAIELRYPKSEVSVIDLGLGDSELAPFPSEGGLRGWSGGARSEIFVGVDAATPGYVAGPIQAGTWQVILGLYRMPETPVPVEIDIRFSFDPRTPAAARPPAPTVRKEPGWYKGDLQCHTFHSDAKGAPEHLHATARREGLDFLAVTDHNTMTAHAAYFDAANSHELIFVPAYEFTTEFGHANVFGPAKVFDFRVRSNDDAVEMVRRIRESGALFSPNHDKPVIPFQYDVPQIDCMEVWQGHWLSGNWISLARYQERLVRGERVTAIGASDFHQPGAEPEGNPFTLARPCTYLWLEDLSVPAVLDALRAGRSFVTDAPDGPMLTISAGEAMLGGKVPPGPMSVRVETRGAVGDMVCLIDATGVVATRVIDADPFTATLDLDTPQTFVRAEIIAKASHEAIVSDLIGYLGDKRPGHSHWDDGSDHPIRRALTSPIYIG